MILLNVTYVMVHDSLLYVCYKMISLNGVGMMMHISYKGHGHEARAHMLRELCVLASDYSADNNLK
jgi:hypothetical protein